MSVIYILFPLFVSGSCLYLLVETILLHLFIDFILMYLLFKTVYQFCLFLILVCIYYWNSLTLLHILVLISSKLNQSCYYCFFLFYFIAKYTEWTWRDLTYFVLDFLAITSSTCLLVTESRTRWRRSSVICDLLSNFACVSFHTSI